MVTLVGGIFWGNLNHLVEHVGDVQTLFKCIIASVEGDVCHRLYDGHFQGDCQAAVGIGTGQRGCAWGQGEEQTCQFGDVGGKHRVIDERTDNIGIVRCPVHTEVCVLRHGSPAGGEGLIQCHGIIHAYGDAVLVFFFPGQGGGNDLVLIHYNLETTRQLFRLPQFVDFCHRGSYCTLAGFGSRIVDTIRGLDRGDDFFGRGERQFQLVVADVQTLRCESQVADEQVVAVVCAVGSHGYGECLPDG